MRRKPKSLQHLMAHAPTQLQQLATQADAVHQLQILLEQFLGKTLAEQCRASISECQTVLNIQVNNANWLMLLRSKETLLLRQLKHHRYPMLTRIDSKVAPFQQRKTTPHRTTKNHAETNMSPETAEHFEALAAEAEEPLRSALLKLAALKTTKPANKAG